ncbi:hypothetical protein HK096_002753, partial [Nowakowskiella sp. JEL0078]
MSVAKSHEPNPLVSSGPNSSLDFLRSRKLGRSASVSSPSVPLSVQRATRWSSNEDSILPVGTPTANFAKDSNYLDSSMPEKLRHPRNSQSISSIHEFNHYQQDQLASLQRLPDLNQRNPFVTFSSSFPTRSIAENFDFISAAPGANPSKNPNDLLNQTSNFQNSQITQSSLPIIPKISDSEPNKPVSKEMARQYQVKLASLFVWALVKDSFGILVSSTATTALSPKIGYSISDHSIINEEARFITFCEEILRVTELSESVIYMALRYVALYTQMKNEDPSSPGILLDEYASEFKVFVVGLIIANKTLEDNPYTNKTWSEVSKIPVEELTLHEREFLSIFSFRLLLNEKHYLEWKSEVVRFVEGYENYRERRRILESQKKAIESQKSSEPMYQNQSLYSSPLTYIPENWSQTPSTNQLAFSNQPPPGMDDLVWSKTAKLLNQVSNVTPVTTNDSRGSIKHKVLMSQTQPHKNAPFDTSMSSNFVNTLSSNGNLNNHVFSNVNFSKEDFDITSNRQLDSNSFSTNAGPLFTPYGINVQSNIQSSTPPRNPYSTSSTILHERLLAASERGYPQFHGFPLPHDEEADHVMLLSMMSLSQRESSATLSSLQPLLTLNRAPTPSYETYPVPGPYQGPTSYSNSNSQIELSTTDLPRYNQSYTSLHQIQIQYPPSRSTTPFTEFTEYTEESSLSSLSPDNRVYPIAFPGALPTLPFILPPPVEPQHNNIHALNNTSTTELSIVTGNTVMPKDEDSEFLPQYLPPKPLLPYSFAPRFDMFTGSWFDGYRPQRDWESAGTGGG